MILLPQSPPTIHTGLVTTIAGQTTAGYLDAVGTLARFHYPYGVAVDTTGTLYVADCDNHMLRKITTAGMRTSDMLVCMVDEYPTDFIQYTQV